jgi:hypothetical protein
MMKKRVITWSVFLLMFLSVAIAFSPNVSAADQDRVTEWSEEVQTQIAGSLSGTYYYQDNSPSVNFRGIINQQGNKIWGNLIEPRTFGPIQAYLDSAISGTIEDNTVNFVKTYTYDRSHTVEYWGTYYPREQIIRGAWFIGEISGPFEITIN